MVSICTSLVVQVLLAIMFEQALVTWMQTEGGEQRRADICLNVLGNIS